MVAPDPFATGGFSGQTNANRQLKHSQGPKDASATGLVRVVHQASPARIVRNIRVSGLRAITPHSSFVSQAQGPKNLRRRSTRCAMLKQLFYRPRNILPSCVARLLGPGNTITWPFLSKSVC